MLVAFWLATTSVAHSQTYPVKPIRLIVPFPAGGTTDVLARIVGQQITEAWGHSVVVENKSGAGGTIGTEFVARAASDGYTLVIGNFGPIAIAPSLYKNINYDPLKDLAPITLIATTPNILLVNPRLLVKTIVDLIALAKAKPGSINYASAGVGISNHLGMELFKQMAHVNLTHVPYKGSSPALADLIAGQVSVAFDPVTSSLPFVKSGRLRAIAIGSGQRSGILPTVPTVAESGLTGFESGTWNGILAPSGTSRDILDKLSRQLAVTLEKPAMRQQLRDLGSDSVGNSPDQFRQFIQSEQAKWSKVIRDGGIKLDD